MSNYYFLNLIFVLHSRHYFKHRIMSNRTAITFPPFFPRPSAALYPRSMGAGIRRRPCGALVVLNIVRLWSVLSVFVPRSCSGTVLGSDSLRWDGKLGIVCFAACTLHFLVSDYGLVFPSGFVCFYTPLMNTWIECKIRHFCFMNDAIGQHITLTFYPWQNIPGVCIPLAAGIKVFCSLHWAGGVSGQKLDRFTSYRVRYSCGCMRFAERELAAFQRAFDVLQESEISIRLAVYLLELGQVPTTQHKT